MEELRQLLGVALVFILLGLAVWALRAKGAGLAIPFRRSNKGSGRLLHSVDRLTLTPQHSLHVVRFSGRELLVATHPQGCSVVSEAAAQAFSRGARA